MYHKRIVALPCYNNNHMLAVRFSLKDLEKAYAKTEADIKAVQSVGQIVGEVMKQLDDDRCMCSFHFFAALITEFLFLPSHREGFVRPTLCRLVPTLSSR